MYPTADSLLTNVTLVGFPLGSTGRSEHVRAVWRALKAAGIESKIYSGGGYFVPAREEERFDVEVLPQVVDELSPGIRIYSLNGDEVPRALERLETQQGGSFQSGYNIVFPAWELPRYPEVWAREHDRFDEVWTASPFADESIRTAVRAPVFQLPNACEPHIGELRERADFGIPDDRFVVLFFFDLWSYTSRKNPWAIIETFRRLVAERPFAPVQLVIKLNHSSHDPSVVERIRAETVQFGDRVLILDATLEANEVKNLLRCCDCFLSLHRAEGFGRGPAEAMFFGKPVVATGWSGNMEYMNSAVSFPVEYRLIPVQDGEYPCSENQVWADPDIEHAAQILVRLVDDPAFARAAGDRARLHMRMNYSDAAIGKRYRARLEAIARIECGGPDPAMSSRPSSPTAP
jgi:glycosyltransferase involved in cell wall biosynthesis